MTTQAACTNSAQVAITALRYLAEDRAVPGRDLLRNERQPSGEVAAFADASPVPIAATPALEMIVRSPARGEAPASRADSLRRQALIVGRCTASAIACASRKSLFCSSEQGWTYFGGVSRAS